MPSQALSHVTSNRTCRNRGQTQGRYKYCNHYHYHTYPNRKSKRPSRLSFHLADQHFSPSDEYHLAPDPNVETLRSLEDHPSFRPTKCYRPEWISQYPDLPILVKQFCDLTEMKNPLYDCVSNVSRLPDVYPLHLMVYAMHIYTIMGDDTACRRILNLLLTRKTGNEGDGSGDGDLKLPLPASPSSIKDDCDYPENRDNWTQTFSCVLTILSKIPPSRLISWLRTSLFSNTITSDDTKSILCLHLWSQLRSGLGLMEIACTLTQSVSLYRWGFGPDQINAPIMLMFDTVAHMYPKLVKLSQVLADQLPTGIGLGDYDSNNFNTDQGKSRSKVSTAGRAWSWFLKQLFACNRDIQYYHRLLME